MAQTAMRCQRRVALANARGKGTARQPNSKMAPAANGISGISVAAMPGENDDRNDRPAPGPPSVNEQPGPISRKHIVGKRDHDNTSAFGPARQHDGLHR